MKKLIIKLKKKLFYKFALNLAKFFPLKNSLVKRLFDYLVKYVGESVYFESHKDREILTSYISKINSLTIKNNQKFNNVAVNKEIDKVVLNLQKEGIDENINIQIPDYEREEFIKYIENSNFHDAHVKSDKQTKKSDEKVLGPYKSYNYSIQLNNPTLLKICLNPTLLKIAQLYLGCPPVLDSINTFVTLPPNLHATEEFPHTHEFHRDTNNLKQIVFFIYWTKTTYNDGAFDYIKYTHKPSKYLSDCLNKYPSNFNGDCEKFLKNTIPGFAKCEFYEKLFEKDILRTYGSDCKIVACDPIGLHRGTPVISPRMVTWVRFGVTTSRQILVSSSEETKIPKVKLNKECNKFLADSEFSFLIERFLK